ncbi:MAG: signal peptidase II [Acidobacteriota bacterium]
MQLGSWHYPTFNVADMAICIGAGLLILDMLLSKKTEAESLKTEMTAGSGSEQRQ